MYQGSWGTQSECPRVHGVHGVNVSGFMGYKEGMSHGVHGETKFGNHFSVTCAASCS